VLDGTWKSQESWEGLKDGMLIMADYTNLPDDVVQMAEETEAAIISGDLHPFKGPVYKQDGTEVVGEGEVVDDGTLLGMNWYVKGIDGEIPQ